MWCREAILENTASSLTSEDKDIWGWNIPKWEMVQPLSNDMAIGRSAYALLGSQHKCVFVTSSAQYVQHIFRCRVLLRSSSHGVDELVHQSARHVRLPDDALLVVLADGATQFVIVHSWPVLPDAP